MNPPTHLGREFFQRDPLTCARELIGCELVWNECIGIIVETEAYTAFGDEASHTFVRPSTRAFIADHTAGTAYVYLNYGMYWLLNVLVKGGSEDGFVLFRALQPVQGIEEMQRRRQSRPAVGKNPLRTLCSGPGKMTIALGVDGRDHGRDLCTGETVGFRRPENFVSDWISDVRIGISKSADFPWRFLAAGNSFASVKAPAYAGKRGSRSPRAVNE